MELKTDLQAKEEDEKDVIRKAAGRDIILFDGVCNLCNGAINFIMDRDKKGKFAFASLQSNVGSVLLKSYSLPTSDFKSFILISDGKVFNKSTAALKVAEKLGGFWSTLSVFKLIPTFIRDSIYNIIAENRYKLFGKRDACRIPTPEIRNRFLEGL